MKILGIKSFGVALYIIALLVAHKGSYNLISLGVLISYVAGWLTFGSVFEGRK
jgi:hypothetical protein